MQYGYKHTICSCITSVYKVHFFHPVSYTHLDVYKRQWKGNAYIDTRDADYAFYNDWTYRYVNVDQDFNDGPVTYNHTATVMQVDEKKNDPETQPRDNAVRTFSKEVFSKGVGMVYREYYRWTYDANSKSNTDINNIDTRCLKGTGVIMRAVDHN